MRARKEKPRHTRLHPGIRRAMAEVTIMRIEAEDALQPHAPGNVARRARIKSMEVLYNKLNRVLLEK